MATGLAESCVASLDDTRFLLCYSDGYGLHCQIGTTHGLVITYGATISSFDAPNYTRKIWCCKVAENLVLFTYCINNDAIYAVLGSVSGDSVTFGTRTRIRNVVGDMTRCKLYTTGKAVVAYMGGTEQGVMTLNFSGTTITSVGTPAVWDSISSYYGGWISFDFDTHNMMIISYTGSDGYPRGVAAEINGDTITTFTPGNPWYYEYSEGTEYNPNHRRYSDVVYMRESQPYSYTHPEVVGSSFMPFWYGGWFYGLNYFTQNASSGGEIAKGYVCPTYGKRLNVLQYYAGDNQDVPEPSYTAGIARLPGTNTGIMVYQGFWSSPAEHGLNDYSRIYAKTVDLSSGSRSEKYTVQDEIGTVANYPEVCITAMSVSTAVITYMTDLCFACCQVVSTTSAGPQAVIGENGPTYLCYVKNNGAWSPALNISVKNNGAWSNALLTYVKSGGNWQQ